MPLALVLIAVSLSAGAADWPQWGGPDRNFVLPGNKLQPWAESGPRVLWRRPAPFGNSSISVDGKRLYTMYRGDGETEVVLALDADTGKTVWEYKYPAEFLKGMNMNTGPGPHATILVAGSRVYAVGVTGK